ncbi:hypothetical protein BH10ACT11_BH10ACT11_02800 [soil metagenome]
MSTLAIDGPETVASAGDSRPATKPAHKRGAPALLKKLDLLILLIGIPIVLLADLPVLGYAVGAAAWLGQRGLFILGSRRARAALIAGDRRAALGYTGFSTLGRVWLVTLAVLLVGLLGARQDGLTAAVLSAILVTSFLISQAIDHFFAGPVLETTNDQEKDAR